MATEIERKFLVISDDWRADATGVALRQGYLSRHPDRTVRVRIAGTQAFITVKGRSRGVTRLEFEYPVPLADAGHMLEELCERPLVEKTRHTLDIGPQRWEIDEFHGDNQGLIVAEIELLHEDQSFERPAWLGREVSADSRYFNANLASHPYSRWSKVDSDPF